VLNVEATLDLLGLIVLPWAATVFVGAVYLVYAGRLVRHAKQFHGQLWQEKTRYTNENIGAYPNLPIWALWEMAWDPQDFQDKEFSRLALVTRVAHIAWIFSFTVSLILLVLYDQKPGAWSNLGIS
jgi:hypothetical protein